MAGSRTGISGYEEGEKRKRIRYIMEGRIWHQECKGEGFKDEGEIIKNKSRTKEEVSRCFASSLPVKLSL
jgi:hypothetical protein